jgi:hypothetical protein
MATAAKTKKTETSTELESVQERIRNRLATINETTQAVTGQNISTKGKTFRLPDGKTSPGPLNCIIVDYINKNMYYKEAYVEGEFAEPDCFAIGRKIKDMVPSASSKDQQNADCDTCKHNEFGSKGRGKACANNIMLAVLPEDFDEDSELYTLKVSATALTYWTKYVRSLSAAGVDPLQVVTSISMEESLAYPSLRFKHIGGNEQVDKAGAFLAKAEALLTSE